MSKEFIEVCFYEGRINTRSVMDSDTTIYMDDVVHSVARKDVTDRQLSAIVMAAEAAVICPEEDYMFCHQTFGKIMEVITFMDEPEVKDTYTSILSRDAIIGFYNGYNLLQNMEERPFYECVIQIKEYEGSTYREVSRISHFKG